MKSITTFLKHAVIAAGIVLVFPLSAQAQQPPSKPFDNEDGPMMPHNMHEHERMMPDHMSFDGSMPPPGLAMPLPEPGLVPPFLHGLILSEAQQDKIFSIALAEAPLLHEQNKLIRKSAEQLHQLMTADQYDEGRIKLLAEENVHALAQITILHARSMHQILSLLTPEQRMQINNRKAKE